MRDKCLGKNKTVSNKVSDKAITLKAVAFKAITFNKYGLSVLAMARGETSRFCIYGVATLFVASTLISCSLSEEMKRIEASKQYEEREDASRSSDLTGEEVFMRSCNTCHPGGKQGMGPSLIDIEKKYPQDELLKAFIRKGRGIMPSQPPSVINDVELTRLVEYLKTLKD